MSLSRKNILTPSLVFTGWMHCLSPRQQLQSTERNSEQLLQPWKISSSFLDRFLSEGTSCCLCIIFLTPVPSVNVHYIQHVNGGIMKTVVWWISVLLFSFKISSSLSGCWCSVGLRTGGRCSEQCEVLDGQRRCWGDAADMCQTCQFFYTLLALLQTFQNL